MHQDNVMRDSRGEMDMIYDDVERREQEINIARSRGEDPFVDGDVPPPPGERGMPPSGDDEYDFGRPRRAPGRRGDRWEGDDFRRESYREDDDRHVRVSRLSW
jgi:hypothetical protein